MGSTAFGSCATPGGGWRRQSAWMLCILLLGFLPTRGYPDGLDGRAGFVKLDQEVRALKKEILAINRELLLLEEELLYPADQQLVVLVSLVNEVPVTLTRVVVELDGEVIARHRYSDGENQALRKGGIHRPYTGRFTQPEHRLLAFVAGTGVDGTGFQRSVERSIAKGAGPKYIELRIEGSGSPPRADVGIYEW